MMIPGMEHRSIIKDMQSHGIPIVDDGHTYCIRIVSKERGPHRTSFEFMAAKLKTELMGTFSVILRIIYRTASVYVLKTGSLMNSIRILKGVEGMDDETALLELDSYFFGKDAENVIKFCF